MNSSLNPINLVGAVVVQVGESPIHELEEVRNSAKLNVFRERAVLVGDELTLSNEIFKCVNVLSPELNREARKSLVDDNMRVAR